MLYRGFIVYSKPGIPAVTEQKWLQDIMQLMMKPDQGFYQRTIPEVLTKSTCLYKTIKEMCEELLFNAMRAATSKLC
jgi:hypothetical protein